MNRLMMKLMARGYWNEAGAEGAPTGGGGIDGAPAGTTPGAPAGTPADKGEKKPTDEEAKLLKEVMDKKAKLEKANADLAEMQGKLKQFEGIDPEAIRKMLADQKTAEEKQLEAKGDYERLKQRMADEHSKEVKTLKEQLEALSAKVAEYNGTINELTIGGQFTQSPFIAEELTLTPSKARLIYGDHFDLVDGKIVGYDKPRGSANRTALVDQYGSAIGFDAAMRAIVESDPEKDHLFKSKIKPGAGSSPHKPNESGASKANTKGAVDKIAAGLGKLAIN